MRRSMLITDGHGNVLAQDHADLQLPIYSIAKTFIAAAVINSGIDVNTPVRHWIPQEWLADGDVITVEHLLHHNAGLADYGGLQAYHDAIQAHKPPWSDATYRQRTLDIPRLSKPGEQFAYSNPGYWLLKTIVERENNASWSEILQAQFVEPLGLTNTRSADGVFADDLPNYPAGWVWHGVILSTATDLVQFMASDTVALLAKKSISVGGSFPPWKEPRYGYGVMMEAGEKFGHNGGGPGYTSACYRYLNGLTGCVLLNSEEHEGAMFMLNELVEPHLD